MAAFQALVTKYRIKPDLAFRVVQVLSNDPTLEYMNVEKRQHYRFMDWLNMTPYSF
jgi:hypothetical protein